MPLKITKVKEIKQSEGKQNIYYVICTHTRYKKQLFWCVIFWGDKVSDIVEGRLTVGMRIDLQYYSYSKLTVTKTGKEYWNTYIVCEKWRKYEKKQQRHIEVPNTSTGEIIKVKNKIP